MLAFGNGAPDVFSSLAAITNAKGGDVGLAFGAILGNTLHTNINIIKGRITLVHIEYFIKRQSRTDFNFRS